MDDDTVAIGDDLRDGCAEPDPSFEARGERLDEPARAAEDVAREAGAPVPDEVEIADAVAGRELLGLPRRAVERGAEDRVDVVRQRADVLAERAVVEEVEHALLALGGRLTRPLGGDRAVAPDREPELHAGAHERDPRGQR